MCHVIKHIYQNCRHHHHWELVLPCYQGFNGVINQCNARNHEFVCFTHLPEGQPLCCKACLCCKLQWLKQAFYVMLIRLKAATMDRSLSDAELDWRYRTWRDQSIRERHRLIRACGHETNEEAVRNTDEDENDEGWRFQLPQAEVRAQLRDLNERFDRGDLYAAENFWIERPGSNGISVANRTRAPTLLVNLNQDFAVLRSINVYNHETSLERLEEPDYEEDDCDGIPGPQEYLTTLTRADLNLNSEFPGNGNNSALRGHQSHDSLLSLFEEAESSD